MKDLYRGREQSEVKHRILEAYIERLAYKVLSRRVDSIAYVDGFSGPWSNASDKFDDTSFARALRKLKEVQAGATTAFKKHAEVRCVFVERDRKSFERLREFAAAFHAPEKKFHVLTLHGEFENFIHEIIEFCGSAFRMTFIDPTGWTGYSLQKIAPLLRDRNAEVIINFMYEHINRFVGDQRSKVRASLMPILGESFPTEIESRVDREQAITELFCRNLREISGFKYVVPAPISRADSERTHFILAYATHSIAGLEVFRDAERQAQIHYAGVRALLQETKAAGNQGLLLSTAEDDAERQMQQDLDQLRDYAKNYIVEVILPRKLSVPFNIVAEQILLRLPLRLTEIKQACVALAKDGVIEPTWRKRKKRTPQPDDLITLV